MAIKALFFDVGNTLLFPNRERMLRTLHDTQVFPSEELLLNIERQTKREFDSLLESRAAVDHGFWQIYYSHLLANLGLSNENICSDLVTSDAFGVSAMPVREALQRLASKYRLGVISNADGKIAEILDRCGIAVYFETITDSGIVGKEKPHPAIFKAALQSLGVAPEQSLYTGDFYSVDYLGAQQVGMQSVLFDVAGAYKETELPRVESLAELEAYLASR